MTANDAYATLMERPGHPGSTRLRPILEHLMTPEQAQMVVALPGTPEVERELDRLGVPRSKTRKRVLVYERATCQ